MEYFDFNRFLSVQIKMVLVCKKIIFGQEMSSVLTPYQSTHVCMQLDAPFFTYFTQKKNLNLFAMHQCNKMCFCVRLLEWLHW